MNKDIIVHKDWYGCVTDGWIYYITYEKPNGKTYKEIVSMKDFYSLEVAPTELLDAWKVPVKILGITVNYKSMGKLKRLCDGKIYEDSIGWGEYKNFIRNE